MRILSGFSAEPHARCIRHCYTLGDRIIMKVLKFGGTSVATAERILGVLEIVKERSEDQLVVTVSAFGGVTNDLIAMSTAAASGDTTYKEHLSSLETRCLEVVRGLIPVTKQSSVLAQVKVLLNELAGVLHGAFLVRELSPKTSDFVVSFGERISSQVIARAFVEHGVGCEFVDSREVIRTDHEHGNANVDFPTTNAAICERLKGVGIAVVPGFIASNSDGHTTTLGRGGSDYTAAIFAAAMDAEILEIWTDVNGMMTADPRQVPQAIPIPEISYREAMELSHFGAKVVYPPSIQPVRDRGIPIAIKNTFEPGNPGTLIKNESSDDQLPVKGLSCIKNIALMSLSGAGLVGVPGSSRRLFQALSDQKVNVILITQASSEHSITIAIDPSDVDQAMEAIESEFAYERSLRLVDPPSVETGLSIIALVGENMRTQVGISGKMFSSLGQNGVNIRAIAQGSSERNISAVISAGDARKALNVLHEAFFLFPTKKANLFIVGVGTVGSVLVDQLTAQAKALNENLGIEVRLCGLANSKKHIIDLEGIPFSEWRDRLSNEGVSSTAADFVAAMKAANLHNSIFIDNTANESVAGLYEKVLSASIHVVTPNKIAASGPYAAYQQLKQTARRYGVKYLFETNVGAGLPVIGTLNDLVQSGDRIHKMQAVLSGSLNFIFNNFRTGVRFADVVRQAQKEGYTEPDPRIDLSGKDVIRKILILARESGFKLEMEDIVAEDFMPPSCLASDSVDDFYTELETYSDHFDQLYATASAAGKQLKFVASYADGRASVGLQSVGPDHPFFNLSGKDNIVLFTTDRYDEQPLVIKGAGAGAEVTAMGVFADIMRIVNI